MLNYYKNKKRKGFTLVETLVATSIFVAVSVGVYAGFVNILRVMNIIRTKEIMTNIANEQFEIVRNLSYQDVGTVSGIPSGLIPQTQTIDKDNKTFTVDTVVRNFDDPFDGTFGGVPNDTSPADMKLVELTIYCSSCENSMAPVSFTTKVSPKNLETASTNGALVVKVFDASGLPVSDVDVHIVNSDVIPNIDLNDKTDVNGILTIVDAPPSVNGYKITVSKNGYSTDRTYTVGDVANPNPTKPDITVVVGQISQISFTIDHTSTINVSTINNQCVATSNFNFDMSGSKLIGTSPDTLKYSTSHTTNASGLLSLSNIEWDTYNILGTDGTYDIIGTNPLLSLGVNPGVDQDMQIITAPKNGRRLLVVVRDQSTGLPVTDATVTLTNGGGYSNSIITNEGFLNQTDWQGGDGQIDFVDSTEYLDSDGHIDDVSVPGSISLSKIFSDYDSTGYLTSSTFDTGGSSNFKQIIWNPVSQPIETGVDSIKVQIATNNDNTTWDFVGPDGTSSTYYTASNQNIGSSHNGHRYLRYRIYLSTLDTSFTPTISDISVTYTSSCIPPGQVSFSSLSSGTYNINVDKSGYQSASQDVDITNNWTKVEIIIAP